MISFKRLHGFSIIAAVFTLLYACLLIYLHVLVFRLIPVEGHLEAAWKMQRNATTDVFRGRAWYVDVRLRYAHQGKAYESDQLNVAGGGMMLEPLADWKVKSLGSLPRPVTVWVDPDNPRYAVLERDVGIVAWIFLGVLILITWALTFLPRKGT